MTTLLAAFWSGDALPYTFAFLLGFSLLVYIILDGYDLGVGILSRNVSTEERDTMISSIGPFWDANETWLVLASGLLLVAFPLAHGPIFQHLYIPITIMLIGLILRGVSFDFRAKVPENKKPIWNRAFFSGSILTSMAQGYMMGAFMISFNDDILSILFCWATALFALSAYGLIGSGWLIMKTHHQLQQKAFHWAKLSLITAALGTLFIAILSPLLIPAIASKWLSQDSYPLYIIPLLILLLFIAQGISLKRLKSNPTRQQWMPFALTIGIFTLNFIAIAFSYHPWIIMGEISITEGAASHESLGIILVGTLVCLPVLIIYTVVAYRIFHGKAEPLSYK